MEQHRLAEGQIYDEWASEEAMMALAAVNHNFIAEQHDIYDVVRAQAAAVAQL